MFDTVIRSGAVVDRSILDKEVVVGQGAIVGDGGDFDTPNRREPERLNTGINVVGKRSVIPRGVRVGRNVKIAGDVRTSDYTSKVVKSGASVERSDGRRTGPGGMPVIAVDDSSAVASASTAARATGSGGRGGRGRAGR
jgi:glucose-1-phosphate adenylyltransferase